MAFAKFGRFKVPLPRSRIARQALGIGLCADGALSFLPVLGIWMLPLGAVVLSTDSPTVRRLRRRPEVKVETWRRSRRARAEAEKKGGPE